MRAIFLLVAVTAALACSQQAAPEAKPSAPRLPGPPEIAALVEDRRPLIDALREYVGERSVQKSRNEIKLRRGRKLAGVPAIAALLYDRKVHCTVTVIAAETALTAAHCVATYDIAAMEVAVGPQASASTERYPVVGVAVNGDYRSLARAPHETRPEDANDIALVYLGRRFEHETVALPAGDQGGSLKGRLVFVGYGYDRFDEEGGTSSGLGEKRYGVMQLDEVSRRAFWYHDPVFGTCPGDSGGPAFLGTPGALGDLAGITSAGDRRCAVKQLDMRVDAYLDWIRPRLRPLPGPP